MTRTFCIGLAAYVLSALVAGAGFALFALPRAGLMQVLYIYPGLIATTALLPFLLAKLFMRLLGRDGPLAHVVAGVAVAGYATAVVFREEIWSPALWSFPAGQLVAMGALAGATYWFGRQGLRRLWKGTMA